MDGEAGPWPQMQPRSEIVQIIGRATCDAPGKAAARFANPMAEPDASEEAVTEAVNDTLKAIAASLLMEQVLVPPFNFIPEAARPREQGCVADHHRQPPEPAQDMARSSSGAKSTSTRDVAKIASGGAGTRN